MLRVACLSLERTFNWYVGRDCGQRASKLWFSMSLRVGTRYSESKKYIMCYKLQGVIAMIRQIYRDVSDHHTA